MKLSKIIFIAFILLSVYYIVQFYSRKKYKKENFIDVKADENQLPYAKLNHDNMKNIKNITPNSPVDSGKDQYFFTNRISFNTINQPVRNANLQLRSEPLNPQVVVSPWLQSTIEPEANRIPLQTNNMCK